MEQGARGGWKPQFIFEGDEEREEEAKNLSDDQLLTEAELPDGTAVKVYETDRAYICPNMATNKQKGGTRLSKEILKKELPKDHPIFKGWSPGTIKKPIKKDKKTKDKSPNPL